ncbi:hypothetical protein D9M69_367380 [compost metagenome]
MAAQQQLQQGELLGAQVDASAIAFDPSAQQVEAQVGGLQVGEGGGAGTAAQQGAHPRQQLGEGERLDQVVVGAQLQALHAVGDAVAGGEEQHRHAAAGLAQAAQDLPAVAAGQHHVEDDQVMVAGQRQVLTFEAVARQFDAEAGLAEALLQVLAGLGFVFDDQQFHGDS